MATVLLALLHSTSRPSVSQCPLPSRSTLWSSGPLGFPSEADVYGSVQAFRYWLVAKLGQATYGSSSLETSSLDLCLYHLISSANT